MKYYKYDYGKESFKIIISKNNKRYFIKIDEKFIEISKDIFKICKSSYDKIRYTYKQEVAKSVIYYENFDSATFFIHEKDSPIEQIYIKDIARLVLNEITLLPELDRKIAKCIFIEELSERETAKLLNIPKSTISYRKTKIRKKLIKIINNYLGK